MTKNMGTPSKLVCSRCAKSLPANQPANLCDCGSPLLVQYDLSPVRRNWSKGDLQHSVHSMWRYAPVLPADSHESVTLQEGWTPLVRSTALGKRIGSDNLWIKDEGRNPTDSFKARAYRALSRWLKSSACGSSRFLPPVTPGGRSQLMLPPQRLRQTFLCRRTCPNRTSSSVRRSGRMSRLSMA